MPASTKTSCSSLKNAHALNRHGEIARWRRNAKARYTAMAAAETMIMMIAPVTRLAAIVGPTCWTLMSGWCVLGSVAIVKLLFSVFWICDELLAVRGQSRDGEIDSARCRVRALRLHLRAQAGEVRCP